MLLALADYADDKGSHCFPSIKTLQYKVSLGKTRVFETLKWLEQNHFITRTPRHKIGRQISNNYQINTTLLETLGSHICTPKVHTYELNKSTHITTDPSVEPSVEPKDSEIEISLKITPKPTLEKTMNIKEIQEQFDATLEDKEIIGIGNLAKIYRIAHAKYLPRKETGIFLAPFTMKQMGMFKHMAKRVGSEGAKAVLGSIKNWSPFCTYLEKNTEAYKVPLIPSVPILLKYIESAVQFTNDVQLIAKSPEGANLTNQTKISNDTAVKPNMDLLDIFNDDNDTSN